MTTIDHQQAAIQAGAKALAEHQIGEDWGDDGVAFIGCDCGQWFGKRVDDGEELARTHEAQAALTAATPHLRAAWAAELGATFQSGERWNETYRKGLRTLQYEKAYLDGVIDILALLEGGGE